MQGENFVSLKGTVVWPQFKKVGENNHSLFKGKLSIPIGDDRTQYIKVAAWNEVADGIEALPEGAFIHIHGHIEERSYDGNCKHCRGVEKKYWTEVIIDNFAQL